MKDGILTIDHQNFSCRLTETKDQSCLVDKESDGFAEIQHGAATL
jgi:hypothetical protein